MMSNLMQSIVSVQHKIQLCWVASPLMEGLLESTGHTTGKTECASAGMCWMHGLQLVAVPLKPRVRWSCMLGFRV